MFLTQAQINYIFFIGFISGFLIGVICTIPLWSSNRDQLPSEENQE